MEGEDIGAELLAGPTEEARQHPHGVVQELAVAARFREAHVVEALLDAGADPSLEDNEDNRATDLVPGNSNIDRDSDLVRRLWRG